ncbi:MAG TPA: MFS transporter [Alphaproteobacteria bacterium]
MNTRKAATVVAVSCFAEVANLLPYATFPALIPDLMAEWGLGSGEVGWISGMAMIGYMLLVPWLMGITDRIDARRVLLFGSAVSATGAFGFGLFADGFWSALPWNALMGIGLAGCYMPGLKVITDRVGAAESSRSIVLYTASYSVGVGLSFLLAGWTGAALGWRWAFVIAGTGPCVALAAVWTLIRPCAPESRGTTSVLSGFRAVIRNRAAIGYILAYGWHGYELSAHRAWLVAFLVFVAAGDSGLPPPLTPAVLAAISTFIAMPASVVGNELAMRFGRRRTVAALMLVSSLVGVTLGLAATQPWWVIVPLVLVYSVTVAIDSGSLTAGTVAAADPHVRGATIAIHSMVGFGISALGPLFVGITLDATGGVSSAQGWAFGFAVMAAGAAVGALCLAIGRGRGI